jgi:hypothetical protein
MRSMIISLPCRCARKITDNKSILCLSDALRLIFAIVYEVLRKGFIAARDWFDDIDYTCPTLDTHHYDTKILLINRLRNKM